MYRQRSFSLGLIQIAQGVTRNGLRLNMEAYCIAGASASNGKHRVKYPAVCGIVFASLANEIFGRLYS